MNTRRDFFRTLAAAPLLFVGGVPLPQSEFVSTVVSLPVGCELSFTSLDYVVRVGAENEYGRPRLLEVGPENISHARELLGFPLKYSRHRHDEEIMALLKDSFDWDISFNLPQNLWRVKFERGIVESQGP